MARELTAGFHSYEDVEEGDWLATPGIVVGEHHVLEFAGLSGDFFDIHVDDDYARAMGFPGRVAHGILGLALTDGLKNRAEARFRGVASLSWSWQFRGPILIGDRLSAIVRVAAKRMTRRPERGILTLALTVTNQRGEIVQEGENLLMVLTRAGYQALRDAQRHG